MEASYLSGENHEAFLRKQDNVMNISEPKGNKAWLGSRTGKVRTQNLKVVMKRIRRET